MASETNSDGFTADNSSAGVGAERAPRPAGALLYRQRLATRLTHWLWAVCLFFMLLYLSMMALGSLPVWRQEGLLFYRCADSLQL